MGEFELAKITTLAGHRDELIKAFPEITDLIESIPAMVRLNKTTPENTQALSKISQSFTKLEFNIHNTIQLFNTVLKSDKPFSEFDRTFITDFITILESGDADYQMANQMLEFYYTQKYYDFICEKYETLKGGMNDTTDTEVNKLYWQDKKVELIKLAFALSDLRKIRYGSDPNPDAIVVVNEVLKAFNEKPIKNPQSNLNGHFNSIKNIDKVLEIFIKMKKRIQNRFNERRMLND